MAYEISSGQVSSGITLLYDSMYVYSGGVANSTTVYSYYDAGWGFYGHLNVSNGGVANSTTVNSYGYLDVYSGGTANSTTVNSYGYMYVSSGGVANETTVNTSGNLCVYSGGVANETTVNDHGDLYVYSGCVANDTIVYYGGRLYAGGEGGDFLLYSVAGGTVSNTLATGEDAKVLISYGGIAIDTTVKNDAEFHISSGGIASSATAKNDGHIHVCSAGRLESAAVSDYGVIYVYGGGSADEISVNNCGELHIGRGGTATRIRENGGCVEIVNGANVTFAENSFTGMVISSGMMTVHSGTTANATTVAAGEMAVYQGGVVNSAAVGNGSANFYRGAKATGELNFAPGATVSAYAGSVIDFDVSERAPEAAAPVNDLALIQGAPDYTVTVSAAQAEGTYRLAGGAAGFDSTVTVVTDAGAELGTVAVGGELASGSYLYRLARADDTLSLAVESVVLLSNPADLNGDGRADVVMSITQQGHGAEGATGAWLIQENQTAAWGDLSQRNAGWSIFGKGFTTAAKTTADVYLKSTGNVVGAWVTGDDGKVTGWKTVGSFDSNTQVLGLGDFNADGQTDLLLRNVNGAVGCHLTDGTGWHYFQSLGSEWKIAAVGDLNGDGRSDVVLKHDAGFAGSWLTQSDCTMAWANLDTLQSGYEIVGTGDFNGDGTDDVLLKKGNYYGAWLVRNGNAAGWFGIGDLGGVTVEEIADYDADGIDDLRIRTAAGDLGAQLVKGADTLQWKYYGSVGSEWSTSLAAL